MFCNCAVFGVNDVGQRDFEIISANRKVDNIVDKDLFCMILLK